MVEILFFIHICFGSLAIPEVFGVSFVTLLYAGITSILSFNYFIYNLDTVKILKQRSQSAGNLNIKEIKGSSETRCNEIVVNKSLKSVDIESVLFLFLYLVKVNYRVIVNNRVLFLVIVYNSINVVPVKSVGIESIYSVNSLNIELNKKDTSILESVDKNIVDVEPELENIKPISDHIPKHSKPINDDQLGHYLAGLIDGDGHISKAQTIQIAFSAPDAFLAYTLRTRLGYGNVYKVKNKNAYVWTISNKLGVLKVINLINGKLRTLKKYDQAINNILTHKRYSEEKINFTLNTTNNMENHWLAGFTDADASFQIKINKRPNRKNKRVVLSFQIDQKKREILDLIKGYFGGHIGYRKPLDCYYYGTNTYGSAKKVINYFDYYHLQSKKYISYLGWRKVYRLIVNKEHLTVKGLDKIIKIKERLNKHSLEEE